MEDTNRSSTVHFEPGMLLEVLTEGNEILFRARVEEFDGEAIRIINESGENCPPVVYNTEFKLRGYLPGSQTALYHGTICGSTERMWKLDQLDSWLSWERREFFRQNVSVGAEVCLMHSVYEKQGDAPVKTKRVPCKILDVSGGGVRIACNENYLPGDELRVSNASIMPDNEPFSFRCTVRRVEEGRNAMLYGCQFSKLQSSEQERLIRAIFLLQRQEAQRLKGRR